MDYPKSVPNVGLVEGKFVDENPTTGQVGSLIPSAWGNSVTEELLSVIKAAGLTPDESQVNQLLKAIQTFAAADMKKTVRVATTGAIALSGLQSIDGVALAAGDRVLVKNQANAAQNGLYSAGGGVWVRTQDADENIEVSPGMMVPVQAGTVNYGSIWQLSNITPPNVGATALNFEQVLGNTGIAPGTYNSLTVDRRGRAIAGSNPTTLAGYGITDALRVGSISRQRPQLSAPEPGGTSSDGNGGALQILEAGGIAAGTSDFEYAPRVVFHWSGRLARDLAMSAQGVLCWGGQQLWSAATFNPATKADAAAMTAALATKADSATTYTKTQTTQLIESAVAALVGSSPESLNTLNELAAALGNNPNFATAINDELAKRVRNTGDTMTGPLTLAGLTTNSPSISFKSEEGIGSLNVYRQRLRYIGYYGSESKEIFSADFVTGDVFNGRGALWDVTKYPPAQYLKVNQSLASGSNLHCGSGNSPQIAALTGETGSLEVHNEANNAASAVMMFHRKGIFGAYFGLDTDNQFKVGGLSMGANAHTVWHSGNAPKNTSSMGTTGWWRCADTGLIRMWGVTANLGQDAAIAVAFPMTFPGAILGVNFVQNAEMKGSAVGNYAVKDVTRTGFTIVNGNDGVGPCYWEAWGN
jgi:hypothetical protein